MSNTALAISKTDQAPLRQVVGWILGGNTEADVLDAIGKQWPAEKARPLIVKAISEIAKAGEPDAVLIRGFCLEGTREVYRKCVEVGDHATALRALRQLRELSK
jgi:hypothetical protein